jgi:transcription initiation factor TFIID subunit 6
VSLDNGNEYDATVIAQLRGTLGDFFAEKLVGDSVWARGVLGGTVAAATRL